MTAISSTAQIKSAQIATEAQIWLGSKVNATILDIYLDVDSNLQKSFNTEDPVQLVIGMKAATLTDIAKGVSAYGWGNHASAGYEKTSNKGIAGGYCGLDLDGKVLIGNLPASAIERMVIVVDDAARFALTTDEVQNGDSVKVLDSETWGDNALFVVVDDSRLPEETGYQYYQSGIAAAVEWGNILNNPFSASQPSDFQAASTNLGSLSGLTFASTAFVKMTAAGVFGLDTATYEPAFLKNSGFNLAVGTTVGTVAAGDHTHSIYYKSGDTPTFPGIVGGSAAGSNIIYTSTTGTGTTTGIAHQFKGGTNGGTVIATMLNDGKFGIGIIVPNSLLEVGTFNTSNYNIRSGSFIIQPYDVNDGFMGHNIYYNGGYKRIGTGYGSLFEFYNGQIMFGSNDTAAAGTTVNPNISLKTDFSGNVAIGGNINIALSNFTGAKMVVLNSGVVRINASMYIGDITTASTAYLHIKAGTATAGTAPLKLTAGTNLTTPENGAIEFDGTNLFLTVGGVRKTIAFVP